jgi:hypothetical protein
MTECRAEAEPGFRSTFIDRKTEIMLRTVIVSWCLVSFGCAAFVCPAWADEGAGCSQFKWDVSHELQVMKQTATPRTAATKPGGKAPLLKIDELYELKLSPQSGVTYSAPPAKPAKDDFAQGGLVRFHTGQAGLYRVSLASGHWIDVVDGAQLVKSKDFSGSHTCPRPHKIVEFELPANKELILQFSGSDASVIAAITRVAAALSH